MDRRAALASSLEKVTTDVTLEQQIRERAYRPWMQDGCVHGCADHHWLARGDARPLHRLDASALSS